MKQTCHFLEESILRGAIPNRFDPSPPHRGSKSQKCFLKKKFLDIASILISIAFWGYYEKRDKKSVHFVKLSISFLLHFHQIVRSQESAGERSKNFLSEPNSSKTFWQLGCQVAALFAPLPSSTTTKKCNSGLRKKNKVCRCTGKYCLPWITVLWNGTCLLSLSWFRENT